MSVKVLYLNGCWEYIYNVKSITINGRQFVIETKNGSIKKYDARLKLEISFR